MKLSCKELKDHLEQCLELHNQAMTMRMQRLFDEFKLFLNQHEEIDIFELFVELILHADTEPAQDMCALLAVLDERAICQLEEHDIAHAAAFIRDAMQKDYVRRHLQDFKTGQKEDTEK